MKSAEEFAKEAERRRQRVKAGAEQAAVPSSSSKPKSKPSAPELISRPLSTIEPRAISWLWKGVIPNGKMTLLDGYP